MVSDSYILIQMYRITKELDRGTSRICSAHGITLGQFMVLETLFYNRQMSVGEIKEAILSSDGTIPVIIANLAKAGFVSKEKDEKDQRRSVVKLTEAGRDVIEKIIPENNKMFEEKFSSWTKEEKRELVALLKKYRRER